MFILTVSITPEEVYRMDEHMFNWIGNAITILSIVIAVITIIIAIAGWFSFNNIKKEISNANGKVNEKLKKYEENIDNQNEKLAEIETLRKQINMDLMRLQYVNTSVITSNAENLISRMGEEKEIKNINTDLSELYIMMVTLSDTIPDKKLTASQADRFLLDVKTTIIFAKIAVERALVGTLVSEETIEGCEKIHTVSKLLRRMLSFQNINTDDMTEEEESIQNFLSEIDESLSKMNNSIEESIEELKK